MVLDEEDIVERFIGGLPNNIQGNVIVANPARLQDAIRIANQLIDNKFQGYAARSADNKRRMESRAYTAGSNERKGCDGFFPYCNKYRLHHEGLCTIRKDYPKLRNQNRRNQTRSKSGKKTGNKTGGNEVTAKAYAIGGGGTNPDSNVVTGTFLLNNCYTSMLFDSAANRSFVSTTFSALLVVAPSTLDTSYAVELADGRVSETNIILKGCTNLSSNPTPSTNPNPKGRNHRRSKQRIQDFNLEELSPPIVTMADQRTMAQLLQAPTEGYEDAIVVPCMQTRSSSRLASNLSSNPTPSTNPNPKGRNHRRSKQRIQDFNLEELSPPIVTMADQRTMAQLLQAPTEGYEDAIVVPVITANNFKLNHGLLTLV
nr:reverse transcriptase domain-containing protein [Tanacetum cinerariifolium]